MTENPLPASPSRVVDAYQVELEKLRAELQHERELREQALNSELKLLEARLDARSSTVAADTQNKLVALKSDVSALVAQRLQIIGGIGAVLGLLAFFGIPKYFELTLDSKIQAFEKKDGEILVSLMNEDLKYKGLLNKASQQNTIVLASDYGEHDAYIEGIMGRLEAISSGLHRPQYIELPQNNPMAAAAKLSFIIKYFPKGTVVATLYNPDGLENTQLISWLRNGKVFIGTNNLFSSTFIRMLGGSDHAVRLERVPEASQFHDPTLWGISRIAPAAAAIASAVPTLNPADFGDPFEIAENKSAPEDTSIASGWVIGADRLGNCVTSLAIGDLKDRFGSFDKLALHIETELLTLPFIHNFADAPAHTAFAIDFDGVVNLAVKSGSFPEMHPECREGASIIIEKG